MSEVDPGWRRFRRDQELTLKLSVLTYRRGFFMPIRSLEEIVRRRLMRALFKEWAAERRGAKRGKKGSR